MADRLREAAQAAVEVLEDLRGADTGYDIGDTVRCLRDALAEPPQDWEAVAADQAMTIAMLRTEIAALGEREWTPDDTAYRSGGLPQDVPEADFGESEPIAWLTGPHGEIERNPLHRVEMPQSVEVRVPLFAHPPRREQEVEPVAQYSDTVSDGGMDPRNRYASPDTQRQVMLDYLQLMIARGDWHGVADAAMDLREMEAEQRGKNA